jgi:tetratricopeptide (TPR) repeat protein
MRRSHLRSLLLVTLLSLVSASPASATPDPTALAAARTLYHTSGKSADAQKAFEALAATDPKDPDVNYFLGQLANRRDDPAKALAYFETAVAAEPTAGRHHHGLGDAYGRSAQKAGMLSKFGLAKKCLAAYERAVALEPNIVDFRFSLFEFYRQAPSLAGGGVDKATAQAEAIKKIDANRGRLALATLYVGEKKYPEALAQFDEVLQTSPDDYTALYQVGRLAALTGEYLDRGLTSLRRCLALTPPSLPGTPGHAAAHWRIGVIHEAKKDLPAARAAYEAALALEPKFPQALESLKKLK